MEQEVEATEVEVAPEQVPEARSEYDLHIKVPADMRQKLKDCAELAYKMGDIPKPDLVNLMNLFISWGMAIQKKKWLDRVGYK
jgi:hypothetical protein